MNYRFVTALIVLTIVVIFAAQNAEVVDVTFLFWSISLSRALLLFLVFIGGIVSGWVFRSLSHAHFHKI